VPEPGDEAALLRACAELTGAPLDRSRPLWQMLRRHAHLLRRLAVRLSHPRAAIAVLGMLARQAGQLAREGGAPRVSLNVPVTGHRCLLLIRADLERARMAAHAHGGTVNDVVLAALPPYQPAGRLAQRWMVGVMPRQRLVNLLVSNLPGPAAPLRLGGARILETFQIGVLQGNLTVSVGVISYAGQLNLDVVADSVAVPDVEAFADGISDTPGKLGVLAGS
jgi:hypothetical protein